MMLITLFATVFGVVSALVADAFLEQRVALFGDFAGLQYSLNPGIAFGLTFPQLFQAALILIALVMISFLALMKAHNNLARWGYGLIIGGGIANVIDRLRDGYVTDYFQVGSFPIFNAADSFVTIGVALLLLEAILSTRPTPQR